MTEQACFIDLKKALDTLDYENLFEKLQNHSFRGKIKELLRSFLSDREQYLSMNDPETERLSSKTGFPQVSVLGLFQFLLFINDLPDVSDKAELTMFADDTKLIQSGKRTQCLLSSEMKPICGWFLSKKMIRNPTKLKQCALAASN